MGIGCGDRKEVYISKHRPIHAGRADGPLPSSADGFFPSESGGDSTIRNPFLLSLRSLISDRHELESLLGLGAFLISGPRGGRQAASTPTAASTVDQTAGGVPAAWWLPLPP